MQQLIASARSKHRNSDNQQYRIKANMPSEVLHRRARFFLSSYLWAKRARLDSSAPAEELACIDFALLCNCVEFASRSYALFAAARERAPSKKWEPKELQRTDVSASLVTASVSCHHDHEEDTLAFPFSVAELLQSHRGGAHGSRTHAQEEGKEEDGSVLEAFMQAAELFLLGNKQYNSLALLFQSRGLCFTYALYTYTLYTHITKKPMILRSHSRFLLPTLYHTDLVHGHLPLNLSLMFSLFPNWFLNTMIAGQDSLSRHWKFGLTWEAASTWKAAPRPLLPLGLLQAARVSSTSKGCGRQ